MMIDGYGYRQRRIPDAGALALATNLAERVFESCTRRIPGVGTLVMAGVAGLLVILLAVSPALSLTTAQNTSQAPAQASTRATVQALTQATVQAPTQATVQAPTRATVQAPTRATVQALTRITARTRVQDTSQASVQVPGRTTAQATVQATVQATAQATTEAEAQTTAQATAQATAQNTARTTARAPVVEIVEEETGTFAALTRHIVEFQRRASAEIATHMNAIKRGHDLGAFFLGLAIAFAYGVIHALGPGHGKFVIVSYFLGREVRVGRGVVMAAQAAIVHVIAAVIIVWLADAVLQAGFGIGLSEVPGVRAASFLIIVGIGVYMLYQAVQASTGAAAGAGAGHDHGHGHNHNHGHGHSHGPSHGPSPSYGHGHRHRHGHSHGRLEGGILALAAGMVPCPGAVLIMLYAVANDMIYPGFLLVAAMSLGIGLCICGLGIGAILARQTAMRVMESAGGSRGVAALCNTMNYAGATLVTLVGLVSFIAFLDVPLG